MKKEIDCNKVAASAREIFGSGYNCAQAVAMAYADVLGQTPELMGSVTSSFGGGFARQREVCGAVSGMGVVAGFARPVLDSKDRAVKMANYALIGGAIDGFRQENGSIVCRELLGLDKNGTKVTKTSKRSCAELVEMAARLIGEEINRANKEL